MRNITSLPVVLSSALVLGACGKLPGFAVNAKVDAFQQDAAINDKVDILFVVDNSGSMSEEQANLASSFQDFITGFSDRHLDFQVGVVSTDVISKSGASGTSYWAATGANLHGPYEHFANNGPGTLLAYKSGGVTNDKIVTASTPNFITQFQQNALLGITGSFSEAGIWSATLALSATNLQAGGWNEGFVRDGSLVSVIFLSDEDESRADGGTHTSHYIREDATAAAARVTAFKTVFSALRPNSPDLLRVDAIVSPSVALCSTLGSDGGGLPGTGNLYMELATAYGGRNGNICQNFSQDLLSIGSDLLTLLTRFKLAQKPDGQIEVRVNGVLVPRDETNGWEYVSASQEVEFRGSAVPSADAKIEVTYVPGEPLT